MVKLYDYKKDSLKSIIKQIFSDFNLSKQKKIFIKPNLGGRYPIIKGENTRYDILNEICKIFQENGCKEIVIGHTSLLSFGDEKYDFKTLIKNSKFYRLSKFKIIKFLNLDKAKRQCFQTNGVKFSLPEIIKTHFYINLSSLKTHMETSVSLSLKNQMGLLSADEKRRMHCTDLDSQIAYLAKAAKPQLNIIDGRIGMEGNGPHHGLHKRADIILCGEDMVKADSLASFLMGINFKFVKHIKVAIEEKIGQPISQKQMQKYKKYIVKFRKPNQCYEKYGVVRVWPNKACSGCIFMLNEANRVFSKNPIKLIKFAKKIIKAKKFDIILGKSAELNKKKYSCDVYAIGNCTKSFADSKNLKNFLPGCPPDKNSIVKLLIKNK